MTSESVGRLAVKQPCPACAGSGRVASKALHGSGTISRICYPCNGGGFRWVVTGTRAIAVEAVEAIIDAERRQATHAEVTESPKVRFGCRTGWTEACDALRAAILATNEGEQA